MYRKRTLPSSFTNTPYTPPRKRTATITLTRPSYYRQNPQYQQFLRRKSNVRTGGYLGKEKKFVDYSVSAHTVSTSWALADPTVGALNAVAQGNSESQRIGRSITNASLHINGTIRLLPSTVSGQEMRIVVFKDSQTNGAAPLPSNVIQAGVNGFRNLEWINRFQVLYDKTHIITPQPYYNGSTATGNAPRRDFRVNVPLTSTTTFDGATADISDITDCSYHIMAITTLNAEISYTSRFRFYG